VNIRSAPRQRLEAEAALGISPRLNGLAELLCRCVARKLPAWKGLSDSRASSGALSPSMHYVNGDIRDELVVTEDLDLLVSRISDDLVVTSLLPNEYPRPNAWSLDQVKIQEQDLGIDPLGIFGCEKRINSRIGDVDFPNHV
jgi:hypothetical protein